MSMEVKSAKVDGTEIKDVLDVTFDLITPVTDRKYYKQRTLPTRITMHRRAFLHPSGKLFALATNEDGRRKKFDGEIQLQDPETAVTYALTFKNAFIAAWSLMNPEGTDHATEMIEIHAGEAVMNAGSDNASFKIDYF